MTSENSPLDLSARPVEAFGDAPTERIDIRFLPLPDPNSAPVFIDQTGRRRRRLRWLAYGLVTACAASFVLVGVSIAGGYGTPSRLLPFPNLIDSQDDEETPSVTIPTPVVAPAPEPTTGGGSDGVAPDGTVDDRTTVAPIGAASPTPPRSTPQPPAASWAPTAAATPSPEAGEPTVINDPGIPPSTASPEPSPVEEAPGDGGSDTSLGQGDLISLSATTETTWFSPTDGTEPGAAGSVDPESTGSTEIRHV